MSQLAALLQDNKTQLAQFLKSSKIDPARVLAKSHELESLRPEDREIKRGKRAAVGKEDDAAKAARAKKPRSGKPVTERMLRAALAGQAVSGPAKNRIVRAVNAICAQKKIAETDLRALFLKSKKA